MKNIFVEYESNNNLTGINVSRLQHLDRYNAKKDGAFVGYS